MFDAANGGFGSAPKFPHPATLDLVMEQYARMRDAVRRRFRRKKSCALFLSTRWRRWRAAAFMTNWRAGSIATRSMSIGSVPHFEKMCYDNSELLKNYVHAYQATGMNSSPDVARDIIRWMDEWLSDRAHGGFYASQDADYSMDDDGDYFTWTLEETKVGAERG
jgi:uncharacterized protein